jgi:hypothetical protein
LVLACDRQPAPSTNEPERRASMPVQAGREAPEAAPQAAPRAPQAAGTTERSMLQVQLRAVRSGASEVEIEVALDRPLPPLASMRPTLQVGDEIVRRSHASADGRLDRLVFVAEPEQFARMPAQAEIVLRAGPWSNEQAPAKPRLADVTIGGAP